VARSVSQRSPSRKCRIKDALGNTITPSDQPVCYASAMLRLRRENGGDAWVKRFFRYLATCPEADPATAAGGLSQGSYWLICASLAAQKDLSRVFADEWHFPMTADQRSVMARTNWKQPGLTVAMVANALARAKQKRTPTSTGTGTLRGRRWSSNRELPV
jgi:hypothetical protein